jgi:uncharacterized membrane protein YjgN (DUF898 family)
LWQKPEASRGASAALEPVGLPRRLTEEISSGRQEPAVNQMTSVPPVRPPQSVQFTGDRGEFFRLVSRGALLELVTAGFYRFWLATDMRRHLWANTAIDGDAAEYTGRARELLIGFLVAIAILVPVYLTYFLAGLAVEDVQTFASTPLVLFFYLFGQFAIYRARRYRLTRTVWRGVRFWMTGSGWAYAARAGLWGLLIGLTLGLILPWRDAALERYKMQHSHYGNLQGSFEARGGAFFKRAWWIWLLAIVSIPAIWAVPAIAVLVAIAAPFLYAAFRAIQWRWWLSGIRFGGVSLESNLRAGALIGLYWKVIGWSVLLLAGLALYLGACAEGLALLSGTPQDVFFDPKHLVNQVPLLVLTGFGYLALMLALNVVFRICLMRDLWQEVAQSITVHGLDTASNVTAKGELASALGEGFADGLDVAGF